MPLHLNLEDLLNNRSIESERIEFKEGWNPNSIYRSICAFANDLDNVGGGYILVGVIEENGIAQRPVKGLRPAELADIQRRMIGLNNLIRPVYHPKLFIEDVDAQQILVIWVPGGSNRPYEVPEEILANQKRYFYYIRRYANSVKADGELQQELISLANQIPFDDRPNTHATIDDISLILIQDHLRQIGSKLLNSVTTSNKIEILQQMLLVEGPPEHRFPRNVALMMFNEQPDKFFPATWVDIVHFPNGEGNAEFIEYPRILGPVPVLIKNTLELISTNFLKNKVIKDSSRAESLKIWNYPYPALEEAIANALYHRDYQVREHVEIRILPQSIIILNYGGPDRSIRQMDLDTGRIRPRRYRNRRLGDFLKELDLTEGRATGIPTIIKTLEMNGSPSATFRTDEERTFFEVEIFINEAFKDDEIAKGDDGDVASGNRHSNREGNREGNRDTKPIAISERQQEILQYCKVPRSRTEIFSHLGISNQPKNFRQHMQALISIGYLTMTEPDKPTSKKQKYVTTDLWLS
jgi:ATP-dependent DNA helicase RecG